MKSNNGALENAIYEEENSEDELPRPNQNAMKKMAHKEEVKDFVNQKDYSEKILYDAKIHSPNRLKKK